ncbi:MAG TPA: substrate-binding domain-containing protein, partial [Acidimicrobiales bacterium]|nr:substrate-binding domain-containing protein [Acidimicrobiales bacterium]
MFHRLFRALRDPRRIAVTAALAVASLTTVAWSQQVSAQPSPSTTLTQVTGAGSSFAANEIQAWVTETALAPYNYPVVYTSSSSSDGRFEFTHETVNYAVSDIPYQPINDAAPPSFPFVYVPVTAGGLSFMYNLPHLACQPGDQCDTTLQLSSYSACALMTGGVTNWDSPVIQADNPGLALPDLAVAPVIRTDASGDNFVLQEWCIGEQPQLWSAFVSSSAVASFPNQVTDLSTTQPRSDWPLFASAVQESGSAAAASAVSSTVGAITGVETSYAIEAGFPYARVENASGYYTLPTPLGVDSALAYATQDPCPGSDCGIQQLNFNGQGRWVYNPSTYSYLLAPASTTADQFSDADGDTLSSFFDYALTIGQEPAPQGYAGLGLQLEQYGINTIQATIPGAVPPTSDEQSHYADGDFTPSEVAAGDTTPVPGTAGPSGGTGPVYSVSSESTTSTTTTSTT